LSFQKRLRQRSSDAYQSEERLKRITFVLAAIGAVLGAAAF
jgi:hypothetical protein